MTPEEGQAVRFTQNQNAFYIMTLYPPNGTLLVNSPVPYVVGDQVTVVGGNMSGAVVSSRLMSNGSLELIISDEIVQADQYTWAFKIGFGGSSSNSTASAGIPSSSAPAESISAVTATSTLWLLWICMLGTVAVEVTI